jgi:PIN domain nuclease of toxin-antitoxin system
LRLLIDTHIAIWAIVAAPALSSVARDMISDPNNEIFVSIVSLWEIALKNAAARRRGASFPVASEAAERAFHASGYSLLGLTAAHIHAVANLDPIHHDPFDRLLIAQARETRLRLLTHDHVIPRYGDYVLSV